MRLKQLSITAFKNLRDFAIDFDEDALTTVIVGRNGTGKSNILEALVIIFRDLDLGDPPAFPYQLDYVTQRNGQTYKVHVDAEPARSKNAVKIIVNDEEISYHSFKKKGRTHYLPKYVFGYYSGPSNRMEHHFEKHEERFYDDLLKDKWKPQKPLRPLFYARHVHSQFVLMAFFHEQDQKILDFLREHLRIEGEGLDSVLFVMREPPWSSKTGDVRFWNARGVVQDFLDQLYDISLAPIRLKERISLGFRRSKTVEHLYLYLPHTEALRQLANHYDNSHEFFKALESTYISQLISEVRIRVRVRNADGSLTFHDLSEGEQQLLMVLGLLRFTKEEESLFLLDEPDTHLNPAWSMQYLDFLNSVVGEQKSSHIIMTTHDPLVLASLTKSQVRIFRFEEKSDRILVERPNYDPVKMGYGEILTSNIFGLRSIINPHTLKLIDEKRELEIKPNRTASETKRLQELSEELEEIDMSRTVRDPLYEPFVRAMTVIEREKELQAPVLSQEEQEDRHKLAMQILRRLMEERGVSS